MKEKSQQRSIGLALGGGAALGAAHIGVLRALEEHNVRIGCVAGTSIGGLVGALYAFGKSPDEIGEIARDMKWLDISKLSLSRYGLLSHKKLGRLIGDALGDVSFSDAGIPLAMVATDISTGEKVVLRSGSVAAAVMATTCLPGIFEAVEVDGRLLVDGGIVENVPVEPLDDMGAEFTIAVDLNSNYSNERPKHIIEVLVNAFHFTLMSATKAQTEDADLLIRPDLSSFSRVDAGQVEELIEAGYAEAASVLENTDLT